MKIFSGSVSFGCLCVKLDFRIFDNFRNAGEKIVAYMSVCVSLLYVCEIEDCKQVECNVIGGA